MRLITLLSLLIVSTSAAGETSFPFKHQHFTLDFSQEDAGEIFEEKVFSHSDGDLVYIDWILRNPSKSTMFRYGDDEESDDDDICTEVEETVKGRLPISGRPNPANNHSLLEIDVSDAATNPFTTAECQYFDSASAIRIRGFFHVTEVGIPVAQFFRFRSVTVAADSIPADFFRQGRSKLIPEPSDDN